MVTHYLYVVVVFTVSFLAALALLDWLNAFPEEEE